MSHASKVKGYNAEVLGVNELKRLGFTGMHRTGSVAYSKNAADMVQNWGPDSPYSPVRIVQTQDLRKPALYTMTARDLEILLEAARAEMLNEVPVVVQSKKRQQTWIGKLWRELYEATR